MKRNASLGALCRLSRAVVSQRRHSESNDCGHNPLRPKCKQCKSMSAFPFGSLRQANPSATLVEDVDLY